MKNIHVLPTDKPSRLYYNKNGKNYDYSNTILSQGGWVENQNIYITSDEEIKERDWCYDSDGKQILQFNNRVGVLLANQQKEKYGIKSYFKILLTTDQDLIKDGVQAIDDEFLEWFVKNPSCEDVKIVLEDVEQPRPLYPNGNHKGERIWIEQYKIFIPKEELSTKLHIGEVVDESYPKEFKQETLEEVIEKLFRHYPESSGYKKAALIGKEWQQERSYSEEEVLTILNHHTSYLETFIFQYIDRNDMEENEKWFEQFKKK